MARPSTFPLRGDHAPGVVNDISGVAKLAVGRPRPEAFYSDRFARTGNISVAANCRRPATLTGPERQRVDRLAISDGAATRVA